MPPKPLNYFTDERYQDFSPEELSVTIKQLHPEYDEFSVEEIAAVGIEQRKQAPWAGGTGSALAGGMGDLWDRTKAAWNTWWDDTKGVEDVYEETKNKQVTPDQYAFRNVLKQHTDAADDDILDGIANVAKAVWEEPTGAWHELVGQLPNTGVILGGLYSGGKVGAAAGSFGGPVGTAIGTFVGGMVGMFAGNTLIETGAKSLDLAEGGFTEEEAAEAREKGAIKGGVIATIDRLTMGIGGRLLTAPSRAVEKAAKESLVSNGVDITSDVAVKAALKDPAIVRQAMDASAEAYAAATTVGKRAARGGTAFTTETVSEGLGEYAGTVAAGDEASFTEAALESLMAGPLSIGELHVAKGLARPGELTTALNAVQSAQSVDEAIAAAQQAAGAVTEVAASQAETAKILEANQRNLEGAGELTPEQINQQTIDQTFDTQSQIDQTLEQINQDIIDSSITSEEMAIGEAVARGEVTPDAQAVVTEETAAEKAKREYVAPVTHPPGGRYASLEERRRAERMQRGMELVEVVTPEEKAQREKALKEWDEDISVEQALQQAPTNPAMAAALEKAGLITKQQAADADIKLAAHEAATSPENDLPQPTEAQKSAGNYKKGKMRVNGLDISIENPQGSTREGTDPGGQKWSQTMTHHYGYIRGTVGKDKDHIDTFLGPRASDPTGPVFVVDQVKPGTNQLDEHKVMVGFTSEQEAVDGYLSNYEEGWEGLGGITEMSQEEFKQWVYDPVKTKRRASLRKFKGGPSEQMQQMKESVRAKQVEAEKAPAGEEEGAAGVTGAEAEPEIKFSPGDVKHKREKSSGRYVGAPDWVGNSPSKLGHLRQKLKKLALEGESGRYWYEKSSKAILDFVGGNKKEAEKFVALVAIYSQGTEVNVNMGFALEAYYQWKAGLPIHTGRFPTEQSKKAENILRHGKGWGGVKTNNFYTDLMEEIDPAKVDEEHATMDMWMAIAFDYGSKVLDQGPKYKFAKDMVSNIAREIGWKPHQVQAAIWTSIKTRVEGTAKERTAIEKAEGIDPKNTTDREKGSYAHFKLSHKLGLGLKITPEEIGERGYDFSDVLTQRTVQMSWEATPSITAGDLPGIHSAPIEQQFEYLAAISKALSDRNGEDRIAKLINLHTPPTMFGYSAWESAVGAGAQSMFPVAIKGLAKDRAVVPVSRDMLDLYAAIKGYVLHQDAVVWHIPIYNDALIRQNGFEVELKRPGTEAETKQLYQAIHDKFGTWDLAPGYTQNGYRVLNFNEGLSNKDFQKGMEEVLDSLPDDFGGGDATHIGYRSDGEMIGNNWKENPNGEEYQKRIEAGRPDLFREAADLRARIEAVNRKFDKKYGWGSPTGTTAKFSPKEKESVTGAGSRIGESSKATKRLDQILGVEAGTFIEIPLNPDSTFGKFVNAFVNNVLGKQVVLVDRVDGKVPFNGAVMTDDGNTIYLNVNATKPHMTLLGHEMLHAMRIDMPTLYDDLKASLMPLLEDYGPYRDYVNRSREAAGVKPMDEDGIIEELMADMMGDSFGDGAFWNKVQQNNPVLFRRILTAIKSYMDALINFFHTNQLAGTKYFRDYKAARDVAARALSDYATSKQGKPLAGIQISVDYVVEDTGETVTVVENASTLLKESNARMRVLRDFRRCLAA